MRVTEHFGRSLRQADIDFVDVPVETDILLFVDPYAIFLTDGDWAAEASNRLQDFFQELVRRLTANDRDGAIELLMGVSEPNDARLGFSSGEPSGSSIGRKKAASLVDALAASGAIPSGRVTNVGEFELLVPGIARDGVSDLTISVIRDLLADYTTEQCALHGIPVVSTPSGKFWDPSRKQWRETYKPLPRANVVTPERQRVLLVPKYIVRRQLTLESRDYYTSDVVEFLQSEYDRATRSLAQSLRGGRRRVTKKEIKERNPLSKPFLNEFSSVHPEVLDSYRERKTNQDRPLNNSEIASAAGGEVEWNVDDLLGDLLLIEPGRSDADSYERWVICALERIFYPALVEPKRHQPMNDGRKVIDIDFSHRDTEGAFARLARNLNLAALKIPFECKNYSTDPANPELDQLLGRLDRDTGQIGVLVCRTVTNHDQMNKRCRDVQRQTGNFVLWLQDTDLVDLLRLSRDSRPHWDLVNKRIDEISRAG